MSTTAEFIHAACFFVTQAGPITIEATFSDSAAPTHGVLLFDPATQALGFFEFNDDYTECCRHLLTAQGWGTHPIPTMAEVLDVDDRIGKLLKEHLNLSDAYLANLKDSGYRTRLGSLLSDFIRVCTAAYTRKGSPLTTEECQKIWESQESHIFATTTFEHKRTVEDLREHLNFAEEKVERLAANTLSNADGEAIKEALNELRETSMALLSRIQGLEHAFPVPGAATGPVPTQPQAYPALAPQAAVIPQSLPPLQANFSIDCRTWPALVVPYNGPLIRQALLHELEIYECQVRNPTYRSALRNFDALFADRMAADIAAPHQANNALRINEAFKVLLMEAAKAKGFHLQNATVHAQNQMGTGAIRMMGELETVLGTRFVANANSNRQSKNRGYYRKEKNGGGATEGKGNR